MGRGWGGVGVEVGVEVVVGIGVRLGFVSRLRGVAVGLCLGLGQNG